MRIAMHVDGADIRGNEKQSALLASALSARGHEVHASCRPGGPVEALLRQAGARTSGIRPRGDADLLHALRFAGWLRDVRPDAVLLTSWKRAFVAGWAARRAGVPRVVLRLGGVHRFRPGLASWKYRHALTRYYDAVIVNSHLVAEHLLGAVDGLPRDRVHVVPNGIDLAPAPAVPLRAELGLPGDAALLLAAGGLEHRKGFDVLIGAVAGLDPAVHLAIAGGGADRESLRAQASALGVSGRVHFLGQRTDVPGLMADADAFVVSSRGEGMAVVMLEAIAAGTPVVSTEVGGVREVLAPRDGRPPAGWIVPPDDAGALRAALSEVLAAGRSWPQSVRERIAEATWRLENWLTVERMIEGYERVLSGADA